MDILNKNKLLSYALMLFIIINIISISFFWMYFYRTADNRQSKQENNTGKVFEIISAELELNDSQKIILDSLVSNYMNESIQSRAIIRKYHREINSNITQNISLNDLQVKFDTLGIMKAELDKKSYVFFRNLYNLCQPNQKIKFSKLYSEINKLLTPAPPMAKK